MPKRRKIRSRSCIKCKGEKGHLLVRGLVYCKTCLQALVVQNFKKSINECITPATSSSTVLAVGYSGGLGSTLLLHLVAQSLVSNSQRTRRHRWDEVHVIHVHDPSIPGDEDTLAKIESAVAAYPSFHLTLVPLDQSFAGGGYEGSPASSLHTFRSNMPTQTATTDGTRLLTRRLLERTSKSLGATHLLLGRSMSSLSMSLLSSVCLGRGFTIADERQSSSGGVISFNPLKDLGSKECAAYAWWNNIQVISSQITRPSLTGTSGEIQELTRAFITGLEKDYPSTVSTIVKTCAKVVAKGDSESECRLCSRRMQTQGERASSPAMIAITARKTQLPVQDLCYACETMLTSANSKSAVDTLPPLFPVWADRKSVV